MAIGIIPKEYNVPIKKQRALDRKSRKSAKGRKRKIAHKAANKSTFVKLQTIEPADVIFESVENESVGSLRGRPSLISDPNLHNRRDHLVQIFEACWGQIGWHLQRIKTPDEVIPILSSHPVGMSEDAITAFNMISETHTRSRAALRKTHCDSRALIRPRLATQGLLRDAQDRLGCARAALAQATEEQRPLVEEELAKREKEAQERQEQYRQLDDRDDALLAELKFGGARFAREEMLRFLKSKRYEFTPLNLANAVAGLPYMGWRQSMRRCSKEPSRVVNSTKYQVFKAIRYLISTVHKKKEDVLVNHFRNSIPNLPRRHRLAKTDLAENWFFLERAIRSACQDKPHPRAWVFEFTKRYFSQQYSRSYTDIFLAEQSKLRLSD